MIYHPASWPFESVAHSGSFHWPKPFQHKIIDSCHGAMYQCKTLRQLLGNGRRALWYEWLSLFRKDEMVHDSTTVERFQHWVLFRRSLRSFVSCQLFWDFFKAAVSPAAKPLVCQLFLSLRVPLFGVENRNCARDPQVCLSTAWLGSNSSGLVPNN